VCHFVGDMDRSIFEMVKVLSTELQDPRGRAMFLVLSPETGIAGSTASGAVSQLLAQHGSRLLGGALTIEGNGFRAAAKRALAMSVRTVAKKSYPSGTFPNVRDASLWLAEHIPEMSAQDILDAYATLVHQADLGLTASG